MFGEADSLPAGEDNPAASAMGSMLVGNVIGSNLFNLTFVAGLAGTISPIPVDPALGQVEFPAMLVGTVLLCWFVRRDKIGLSFGLPLLVFYLAAIGISWVLHA
mgnify:CR=1 FL=1